MQVLVVNPPGAALPQDAVQGLSADGWTVTTAQDYRTAFEATRSGAIDAVIIREPEPSSIATELQAEFNRLIRLIDGQRIAGLVVSSRAPSRKRVAGSLVDTIPDAVTANEIRGRLATIERYHGFLQRMEQEIRNMERLSRRLNQHFREVDEEMRLAARLQRDFLPKVQQPIGPLQFATLFRPASWVSGDIFDVFRIDEHHTGFYVADAVGHGVAASLLTMFIKRSVLPRRQTASGHEPTAPSEVIRQLNDVLAEQGLPNCQFVTASYAVVDHRTLTLRYARGGHPYPLLITPGGVMTELRTPGGLLGLFQTDEFPDFETQLNPGDKMIMYTDGIELVGGGAPTDTETPPYAKLFGEMAALPIQEMFARVEARLDQESGSLAPRDDVTAVGVEVIAEPTDPA